MIYCIESKNNTLLENKLKNFLNQEKLKIELVINKKNQTELIKIDNISIIENKLIEINKNIQEDIEMLQCKERILKLKLQIASLKCKSENNSSDNEFDNKFDNNLENEIDTKQIKNTDRIDNLSFEELKNTLISLEQRKAKQLVQHRKYMTKYRKSDAYKQRVSSDEYKQNRNKKYKEKIVTEEQKEKRKEYYDKTKINKLDLIKTDQEKMKFYDWLKLHIKYDSDSKLIWWKLLNKYLNYKTNDLISKIYKEYFIEYVTHLYPTML